MGFWPNAGRNRRWQVLFVAPPRLLKVEKDQAVAWKKARAVNGLGDLFAVIGDVQRGLFHGEDRVHGERDGDLIDAGKRRWIWPLPLRRSKAIRSWCGFVRRFGLARKELRQP